VVPGRVNRFGGVTLNRHGIDRTSSTRDGFRWPRESLARWSGL
jgi:hypothetical protein